MEISAIGTIRWRIPILSATFEAEWLINRSGDIRLKAYNETNDRYYTKTNLTTQGSVLCIRRISISGATCFFWNKWKIRNKAETEKSEKERQQPTHSIITKSDIQISIIYHFKYI